MIGVVYKDSKEIDRGIYVAGKHWTEKYPDQSITICDSADAYHIKNERYYKHGEDVSFKEFQGNHLAYDSNTHEDTSIKYPLPRWVYSNSPIPNYEHSIDEDGEEVAEYRGTVK